MRLFKGSSHIEISLIDEFEEPGESKIMSFPLELSSLSLLLGITSMILLITSDLLSSHYGDINVYVNQERLQKYALLISALFLITVAIRLVNTIVSR